MSRDAAPAIPERELHVVQRRLELKRAELIERLYRVRRDRQRAHEPPPPPEAGPPRPRESDDVLDRVETATSRELNDIRLALERIAAGKYGLCEQCGKPIPGLHLGIRPYDTTCEHCCGTDHDGLARAPEPEPAA